MNKYKPKALIRVESTPEIGSGHSMRMLALTSMLHNHFDLYLAFREMPKGTENLYLQFGVTLINLADTNPDEELDFISLKVNSLDIAIVDGYQFLDYFKHGCLEKKIKLVLIDDLLTSKLI
jgi:spore coat polysaccharide biosynthesis predicted glycosyltransferase SpsG